MVLSPQENILFVACIDKHVGQTLLLKVSPQNEAAREGTRSSDAPLLGLWLHYA